MPKEDLDYKVNYEQLMSLLPNEEYKQANKFKMPKFASQNVPRARG